MLPTIFALSTRPGRAAIGVIRVLGSHSNYIYLALTKSRLPPKPRQASLCKLYGHNGILDHALTLLFNGPKSYTGEDSLELHVHGGTAIVKAVLESIRRLHDPQKGILIRYAEKGEFSRRAFMNGRLDLTEVEGIRELIDAETESQRLGAMDSLAGNTKKLMRQWRTEFVNNMALLTTVVDFGEEHDIAETAQLLDQVNDSVAKLIEEVKQYLKKVRGSEILRSGIGICLTGPPNAGKLSLLNELANNDLAIVSDVAGTTRDVIDVPLDIAGYKVVVGDTAGIHDLLEADLVEQEGIRRAKLHAMLKDLILAVISGPDVLNDEFKAHITMLRDTTKPIMVVVNKIDLLDGMSDEIIKEKFFLMLGIDTDHIFPVSCLSGEGMNSLREQLVFKFKELSMSTKSDPVVLSARVVDLLQNDVLYHLEEFCQWKDGEDVVLASECLRGAVEGIGKITGDAVGVEEILGVVFSSFCIGK
ncbi:P-loop containing nucleoside triphosphate hydrolase protein [Metschnikowia bicuspidata]|uniref:P-loop containing nucleoside triphosphate hydrolase protein n=1 Tax=Metschnikowia bicuspidata TaxID=27322 RepID=A0A4P9ZIG9_9ASCO|nr:P-loop containing nucleoside triphosphate hydrolase protein [Metschnikowia bicuspidata]